MVTHHQPRPAILGIGHHQSPHQMQEMVSLAEVVAARPTGVTEPEVWALLCQAVQALQDLFLSDGVSSGRYSPVVSPSLLLLSSRGRVTLALQKVNQQQQITGSPNVITSYTAPEYSIHRLQKYTDSDIEKMLVYSVGACLKRLCLPTHAAASRLSSVLCSVLTAMARQLPQERASLMHLLEVISDYSKRREQVKPFSHIVMDLYRETIIYRHSTPILPDCALISHKQPLVPPCSHSNNTNKHNLFTRRIENSKTIHSGTWRPERSLFASLEHLNQIQSPISPIQPRPKSICTNEELLECAERLPVSKRRHHMKRNPVKRAASRLYHVSDDVTKSQQCVGPEFVIRASLPSKQIVLDNSRVENAKTVTIIMLNGVKLEVKCKPELTTAGKLFEKIICSEDIEENYFLGLSVLSSGDFVFLPSDVKLSKIISSSSSSDVRFTLFVRIRFFLPSLRGVRSQQTKHLLYLQLRRSLLESQLPCTIQQLYELGGLALQAEFGDYTEKHEKFHYFLLEHYIPEIMFEGLNTVEQFRKILTEAHIQRRGLSVEKAEEDFILLAQSLPNYGVHFYSATLISKSVSRDVWLCVSAQGLNLYERSGSVIPYSNPLVYEIFKWQDIQTLCYSKHFLCVIPHHTTKRKNMPKKYKLKMDHKKSYYTFRLASLHHQFFLRLKTEYSSLQSLSQQFGVLLKDIKNEANHLFKMVSHTSEPSIIPTFAPLSPSKQISNHFSNRTARCKRSKSLHELTHTNIPLEEFQNKENENPKNRNGTFENKGKFSGWDKRKGVKMGIRAFTSNGQRISRSLEAVNASNYEEVDKISLQSSSKLSNSSSGVAQNDIYVLNSSIRSLNDQFLPDFHETLSQSLMEKLKNLSFADERILKSVTIFKDIEGSLGIQVTEGSDGKVYIQSVVPFGPASDTGNVFKGDQIVSVDGQNLLNLKYDDALQFLKMTDNKVELVLSQIANSHLLSPRKRGCEPERTFEKSHFYTQRFKSNEINEEDMNMHQCSSYNNLEVTTPHYQQDTFSKPARTQAHKCDIDDFERAPVSCVSLPRSLGLGRRWRGPVRYPVTPMKNPTQEIQGLLYETASDDEQIFI